MRPGATTAERLAEHERLQGYMKACNAIVRSNPKNEVTDGKVHSLMSISGTALSESYARKLFEPDFCGRIGFADYQLTNNGATVRRLRAKLEAEGATA